MNLIESIEGAFDVVESVGMVDRPETFSGHKPVSIERRSEPFFNTDKNEKVAYVVRWSNGESQVIHGVVPCQV